MPSIPFESIEWIIVVQVCSASNLDRKGHQRPFLSTDETKRHRGKAIRRGQNRILVSSACLPTTSLIKTTKGPHHELPARVGQGSSACCWKRCIHRPSIRLVTCLKWVLQRNGEFIVVIVRRLKDFRAAQQLTPGPPCLEVHGAQRPLQDAVECKHGRTGKRASTPQVQQM